jgi:TM2 domain-containing membrane protein YozV
MRLEKSTRRSLVVGVLLSVIFSIVAGFQADSFWLGFVMTAVLCTVFVGIVVLTAYSSTRGRRGE